MSANDNFSDVVKARQNALRDFNFMSIFIAFFDELSSRTVKDDKTAYWCIIKIFKIL